MSARLRRENIHAYHATVKRLISCIVRTHITTRASLPEIANVMPDAISLVLHNGQPAQLHGEVPLLLDIAQHFRTVAIDAPRSLRIEVVSYVYTVMTSDHIELVSYQWHPHGEGDIDIPHVHIGPAMSRHDSAIRPGEAHKIHLPTGEVSLAEVVRLAITEFGVIPRRDDWETILSRSDSLS